MGIRIEWDNPEKTIMRHIYEGVWSLQDYYDLIEKNYQLIEEAGHKVYIINDTRTMGSVPNDITVAIRRAVERTHPNETLNIIVGASLYIQLLIQAVYRVAGERTERLHQVQTMEEAYEIIYKHMKSEAAE